MKSRRRFAAEFKAKVALLAIRGERTVAELAAKHQLDPNEMTYWKRQAIDKLAKVFDDKATDAQVIGEAELAKLHTKIGQPAGGTVENLELMRIIDEAWSCLGMAHARWRDICGVRAGRPAPSVLDG